MATQSLADADVADYVSQMCRELAGMARKANMLLAFDLLILVAIHIQQHSQAFENPKANSART